MTLREDLLRTFHFEPRAHTPRWELGFWAGTIKRWYSEGLPANRPEIVEDLAGAKWIAGGGQPRRALDQSDRDQDVQEALNLDRGAQAIDVLYNAAPEFPEETIEENDEFRIWRNAFGILLKELKPPSGMPDWLDYPVHNRAEWEKFKADRLQPDLASRVPPDWKEKVAAYRQRDYPLCVGSSANGFFGTIRQFIGFEKLLEGFYDDPAWLHDMFDYMADYLTSLYDQILSQVKADYTIVWEDMCYVAGPLISPKMFSEYMLKPYQKLTGLLRDHGITVVIVDTDGDHWQLIPLFMQGGVTGFYPFEVQSHMDVVDIRRRYPRLQMQGGLDKKAIAAGREAIDRELETKVPLVLQGGYIPHLDHGVPPDVSWDNFCYYRRKLNAMLDEYDAARARSS